MTLLRSLARGIGVVWMLALALVGLGIALYCFDAVIALGSARPDRLLSLVSVRRHVGTVLQQLATPGPTAALALLCGLGAMLLGVLLLTAIARSNKQRLAMLEQDTSTGV